MSRKTGLPAITGITNPQLARILSALRERVAHIDATIDVDTLSKRLGVSGGGNGGGTKSGHVRPNAPIGLTAAGIFGAVLLEVDALPAHAAYIRWYAATSDNVGEAEVAGMSAVPLFSDYVGDNRGRYYWATAVGYGDPGLESAYNATHGVYAASAQDPAAVQAALSKAAWQADTEYAVYEAVSPSADVTIDGVAAAFRADAAGTSATNEPNWGSVAHLGETITDNTVTWRAVDARDAPFLIIDGKTYIDTALIQDATITNAMIESLAANKISAAQLSAISAKLGTVTSGTFKTGANPNMRAEVSSAGAFPVWVGSGAKSAGNGVFYVKNDGSAHFDGSVAIGNVTGAGDLASEDNVAYTALTGAKPPTNADHTASHTANDTAKVAGRGAGTVRDDARKGKNAHTKTAAWARSAHETLIDGRKIYTGDVYVDTLQIKGKAVTVPSWVYHAGTTQPGKNTWTTVAQASVPATSGGAVALVIYYGFLYKAEGAGASVEARVRYGATTIPHSHITVASESGEGEFKGAPYQGNASISGYFQTNIFAAGRSSSNNIYLQVRVDGSSTRKISQRSVYVNLSRR
jgi:hypothetical protein